jgi:subtilisin family serine protease
VNWTASIMASKFLSAGGSGTLADAIDAMEFTIQAKAVLGEDANVRVLSNSWGHGGVFSKALYDEIVRTRDHDMLFVAAAGSSASDLDLHPSYPASYDVENVIAVMATTESDERASFSNWGRNSVHLGAPGVLILSTTRTGYASMSGTSVATAHVSGAGALVLSACDLDTPTLKEVLLDNVDLIDALGPLTVSGGRLNVYQAVAACVSR